MPNSGYTEFNIEDCYGDCRGMPLRIQFGKIVHEEKVVPMVQGNYDACMQDCDRKFRTDFDAKTKGTGDKDKSK